VSSTAGARPVVVKFGSALIVGADGEPRHDVVAAAAAQIAGATRAGHAVCIVTSGAIALGRSLAGIGPNAGLPQLQAASALGQAKLQSLWSDALAAHGVAAAQVLLTNAEIADRQAYLNVRAALRALFDLAAVPVLNENDATATDEISFGDNDALAAQVAVLLGAGRLFLLTSVPGVMTDIPGSPGAKVVESGAEARSVRIGRPTAVGRGGMESKIGAAELAAEGGVPVWIASPSDLPALLGGADAGTYFAPNDRGEPAFKLWLRHGKRMVGVLRVDDGAARALTSGNASLLAVGISEVVSAFAAGDGVEIVDGAGSPIARGVAGVDSNGLGDRPTGVEVVHRDRLVVL
jgi:glutamate 5-kinase